MSVKDIVARTGYTERSVALGYINLLRKGLVLVSNGTVEEAIADLEQQILTGKYV